MHSTWDAIDGGAVWWGRDAQKLCSLTPTFRQLASIAFYVEATSNGSEELEVTRVRKFEKVLRPVYAPVSVQDLDAACTPDDTAIVATRGSSLEAFHVFSLS